MDYVNSDIKTHHLEGMEHSNSSQCLLISRITVLFNGRYICESKTDTGTCFNYINQMKLTYAWKCTC